MKLADKYSRRMLYIVGAGLGIFAWLPLVYVEVTLPVLVLFAVSWGVAAGVGVQALYGAWAGELFAAPAGRAPRVSSSSRPGSPQGC